MLIDTGLAVVDQSLCSVLMVNAGSLHCAVKNHALPLRLARGSLLQVAVLVIWRSERLQYCFSGSGIYWVIKKTEHLIYILRVNWLRKFKELWIKSNNYKIMENCAYFFQRFDSALSGRNSLISESISSLCSCKHFWSRIWVLFSIQNRKKSFRI